MDDYKYKVSITPENITDEDKQMGNVIGKFHKQAATNNALLEDKMFYMIVNERPGTIPEDEWMWMLRSVLRVEVIQKFPELMPYGED